MTNKRFTLLICVPILVLLLVVLPTYATPAQTPWVPDYWPTAGWQTSTPEAQNMNAAYLEAMDEYINTIDWGFAMVSSIVIKNGYIVHETYYGSYDGDSRRNIFSCTKSFISTLVGIALKEGYLTSVDEHVMDFFSDRTIANMDTRKEAMTIEHLLTMTTGIDWYEAVYTGDNSFFQMTSSVDWVQYVLDQPMAHTPGEVWYYNSGASHLLSTLVNISTGQFTQDYAEDKLFNPLGITHYDWGKDPDGNAFGGASLRLTPRDMAKLGFLFLNNGTWDDSQIVSEEWVTTATSSLELLESDTGYGYQWWTSPLIGAYSARGYLGQFINVFPAMNMVVVFTASTNSMQPNILLENYILPAAGIIVGGGIPPNGELITAAIIGTLVLIVIVSVVSVYIIHRRRQFPSSSG
ncbi:MAG: serine hydrolase domain-containing protein [Promethearchaeota archaeon]